MKNKHAHVTAFYLETLLMILVFVAVILMLTQVFGQSRKLSAEAGYLSDAATISESVSAAVRASEDEEQLLSTFVWAASGSDAAAGGADAATSESDAAAGGADAATSESGSAEAAHLLDGADVPTVEVTFNEDLAPAADGPYTVTATWEKTEGARGDYVESEITVYRDGIEEPVLTTKTGTYTGKPAVAAGTDSEEVQP